MASRRDTKRYQVTGLGLVALATSFAITVCAVFLLGLFVGKKNAALHAPREDRVARVPVEDYSRYSRPALPTAPASATASSPTPAGAGASGSGAVQGAEALIPSPAAPSANAVPAAGEATGRAGEMPAFATRDKDREDAAQAAARQKAAEEEAARRKVLEAAAAKAKAEQEAKKKEERGAGYTVQVLNTRRQAEADALVARLRQRGVAASVRRVGTGEHAWYRVRVGSYGTFSEARQMADRCRRDFGLGQAFVSTD